jgi:hypothetical protein
MCCFLGIRIGNFYQDRIFCGSRPAFLNLRTADNSIWDGGEAIGTKDLPEVQDITLPQPDHQ